MSTPNRRFGIGRLAYLLYYAPLSRIRQSIAMGGPVEEWRTARGHGAMRRAALNLPRPPASDHHQPGVELHLLTGSRFWDQTAFCLWTFARHSARDVLPVFYDDGTLTAKNRDTLARLFPAARFVTDDDSLARLHAHLPQSQFPALHERWHRYPNIRKLIAPHLASQGWKLVLDSDLLFFRRPEFLIAWLLSPSQPLHAVDVETCYGYSRPLLDSLAGAPVAERVNVGLCGLCSDALDWQQIEQWCRTLIAREGTHYFLEQALVALLVAGKSCAIAPASDYVTLPRLPEVEDCRAVMHHYVANSKPWYFRRNWRHALACGVRR